MLAFFFFQKEIESMDLDKCNSLGIDLLWINHYF